MGFDRLNDLVHAAHHARKINLTEGVSNTKRVGISQLLHGLGRANQCLTGNTSIVQTVTAHLVALDESDLGLDRRCNIGRHQTPRACPDNHQVAVKTCGPWPSCVELASLQGVHQ